MKPLKDCSEGDILMDSTGSKVRVLGRLDSLIFRSEYFRYEVAWYRPMTVQEAEKDGWKLLTKDGRETMDQKEVERLMNIKIIPCVTNEQS